jgi:hypothetical protein
MTGRSPVPGLFLAAHARALLGKGELTFAREQALEAVELARQQSQPVMECEAAIVQVQCLRAAGALDARRDIGTLLERVLRIVEQTGAERWRPHIHVERAELSRLAGDIDSVRRELSEAHRLFVEMGASGHAARIAHEIAS